MDEANQEQEIILTSEEQLEIEIKSQNDCMEFIARQANDSYTTPIYTQLSSQILGKKVVTYIDYIEDVDINGFVLGRRPQNYRKVSSDINDPVNQTLNVLSQNTVIRG